MSTVGKCAAIFLCSLDALGLWHVYSEPCWYIPHSSSLAHHAQTLPYLFEYHADHVWSWRALSILQACGEWHTGAKGREVAVLIVTADAQKSDFAEAKWCVWMQNLAAGRGWDKGCPGTSSSLSCSADWLGSAHRFCSIVRSSCSQGTNFKLCFLQYPFFGLDILPSGQLHEGDVSLFSCPVFLVISWSGLFGMYFWKIHLNT